MSVCGSDRGRLVCEWHFLFFCKQKTAYEVRISDWSSDVCSSDLLAAQAQHRLHHAPQRPVERVGRLDQALDRRPGLAFQSIGAPGVGGARIEIGRASCRERVCQYVSLSVVAVTLNKKQKIDCSASSHANDTRDHTP